MGLLILVWLHRRFPPGRGPEEAGTAVRGRDGRGVRQAGASVDSDQYRAACSQEERAAGEGVQNNSLNISNMLIIQQR